jgi:DNA-directed RNA polymerase alpha subunit
MNNPPAFPLHNHGSQTLGLHITGMTLRDYFAAKALQGMLVNMIIPDEVDNAPEFMAKTAYKAADAMMKARDDTTSNAILKIADDAKVDELDIPVRTKNILKIEGISTVEQLTNLRSCQLLYFPNMGRKSLEQIHHALAKLGLRFIDGPR